MEQHILRKLQLAQLDIALEIKRVCEENDIRFFLCCGSFLGAVRHQGFIPWDDDLDIGMLREDYERFCAIAPEKMGQDYCLQNWHTDPNYALPFAKVRKRHTLMEERKSVRLEENGIYVDLFPFDNAPSDEKEQKRLARKLVTLFRIKMMKSGMRPWLDNGKIIWKKRIGFLPYQLLSLIFSHNQLIYRFEEIAGSAPEGSLLCRQRAWSKLDCYERSWCEDLAAYSFEGNRFPGPRDYHNFLSSIYGDYRKEPPAGTREDRHQVVRLDFGDGTEEWVSQ